jgi:hypothetical protein
MKNWKSILLLLLVFLAGLMAGVVGTRIVVRRAVQQAILHPERAQMLLERDLARKLRLDADQQAKLHGTMLEMRGQLRELRQEYQPQAVEVLRVADGKIASVLRPEQVACYEKLKLENRPLWRALQGRP